MTIRAILLGLFGAAFVCGYTYINDVILQQTKFIGNHLPLSVFGGLLLFLFLVQPLLRRLRRRWTLAPAELTVILALTLSACVIPGSGLMRYFTPALMMPYHFERTEPGWAQSGLLASVPKPMMPDLSRDSDLVLNGFLQGLSDGDRHIGLADVPWHAWLRPLSFWIPLVFASWLCILGLSLVVHRQWSDHEMLPYPVAEFANVLVGEPAEGERPLFRQQAFLVGLGIVLAVHLNNYACVWFPDVFLNIPTRLDFLPLAKLFPTFVHGGGGWAWRPAIYFTVIAFAYFIANDVSLSLGIAPYLGTLVCGIAVARYDVSFNAGTGPFAPDIRTFLNFGAYLGVAISLVYSGRHYYLRTLRTAFKLHVDEPVTSTACRGARLALGSGVVFIVWAACGGMDWQLAAAFLAIILILSVVMARIIAETGVFFIQAFVFPCAVITGFFGNRAIGPSTAVLLCLMTVVVMQDWRETLMPFLVNGLRMTDLRGAPAGRVGLGIAAAILVGLAVALPTTLYFQYDRGADRTDYAVMWIPKLPFNEAIAMQQRLDAQELLDNAESVRGWKRFAAMRPWKPGVIGFVIGGTLVWILVVCRLKFPWWPLHPVMLLMWNSWAGRFFAFSFLLGCLIKWMVTKYGGPDTYRRLKPFMIGVIAGDMIGGLMPSLVAAAYYLVTGDLAPSFQIMPS